MAETNEGDDATEAAAVAELLRGALDSAMVDAGGVYGDLELVAVVGQVNLLQAASRFVEAMDRRSSSFRQGEKPQTRLP